MPDVPGVVVWADGRLREPHEPVVGALDHGLTVGRGAFETCEVVAGAAFALRRHLERLVRSVRGLGLPDPDLDVVRAGVGAVLAAGPAIGRLRITVTAGPGPLGALRPDGPQCVLVVGGPGRAPHPVRSVRSAWVRNERSPLVGLKATSYAENVLVAAQAAEAGVDEALLANTRGELCEGSGSNVFVEVGGELLTPALSTGCLAGVTRELVLEWAEQAGLPVREARDGELPFAVLDDVAAGRAGLAIASSTRGLVPVVELDGVPLAAFPLTERVGAVYRERAAADLDP